MINTAIKTFNNLGYLETTLTETQLRPVKQEIDAIKNSMFFSTKMNNRLAGNLEHEYSLIQIKDYIEQLVLPYCYEFDKTVNQIERFINKMDKVQNVPLYLGEPWVNFQKKYEFNPPHTHSGVFSFVIWIDIPYSFQDEKMNPSSRNSGANVPGCFDFIYASQDGLGNHVIPADKMFNGKMLVFPARTMHCVYPFYTSDEYRISVSGNFYFKLEQ